MTTSIFAHDETAAPTRQPTPAPVTLRTPHDAALVVKAIETRTEDLKKLAKNNESAGYQRHARDQRADAAALEIYVLPQFKSQQELPFATSDQVRAGIANALRDVVRNRILVRMGPVVSEEEKQRSVGDREKELLDGISVRVERFAEALAQAAYEAGVAARESAPEALAIRSLDAMYGD